MKRPGEIFIFIALLLFFCTTAFCQSYRKLTLNDFKGAINPAHNPDEIAFTSCSIKYSYSTEKENDYYLLTFNIKLVVYNNKSWIDRSKITNKKMMAELLNHEQGHYIIGYLEQQELLTAVSHTVFREDYVEVAKNIFSTINTKYSNLNIEYDTDTQNSTNKAKQHKWDIYFQHQLAEYSEHDAFERIEQNRVNQWNQRVNPITK
jgi:hypothetical protein